MTYGELQASLARLALRTDLTTDWPEFVRRAHDFIADKITLVTDLILTNGAADLPDDFSQVVAVWVGGSPVAWSVDGTVITVGCGSAPAKLLYRPAKAFFASEEASNVVLDAYPWVYRYGALAEAGRFMRDTEMSAQNEAAFRDEIDRISKAAVAAAAQDIRPRSRPAPARAVVSTDGQSFDFAAYYNSLPEA